MSATPPALEGSQAPSQIEFIWERYRKLIYVVVLAVIGALGLQYAWKEYGLRQQDAEFSAVAATLGLDQPYSSDDKATVSPVEALASIDIAKLEAAANTAKGSLKPFFLFALAKRHVLDKQWDKAEVALASLEQQFPNHSYVKSSDYPVQAVEMVKNSKDGLKPADPKKKPEFKPAEKGSAVSMLRSQIAQAKAFAAPAQFARQEVPADAAKVKYELSGGYGSFVVALMPQAPKHREAFLKLAESGFWKDLAVDEIRRAAKSRKQAQELHFGLESTRGVDDRTKWTDTDPSKNEVDFEDSGLSHFAGAVSGRNAADGKSCVDRLWISVEDAPSHDGDRVVFGYVVEGLENLKRVCEAAMTAQEEEQGVGKPSETIRVTAVTKL